MLQHSSYYRVLFDNALYSLFAIIPIVIGLKLPFNKGCYWSMSIAIDS